MKFVHASHTATLLNTGKVLVIGWGNATAELFDPATGIFRADGQHADGPRFAHRDAAQEWKSARGGWNPGRRHRPPPCWRSASYTILLPELFPPAGVWQPRVNVHAASLLTDGKVLVTGGLDSTGTAIASAEVYDPTNQSFTVTKGSMETARAFQTATSLKDGTVLVAGGSDGTSSLATAEVYDPNTGIFSPTGNMANARQSHTATLLNDGTVLVTGGNNGAVSCRCGAVPIAASN